MEENYLDNPVFICGHRKTGTTMLVNLFDGAKDAVVFPDDSTFFYMYHPRYSSDQFTNEEKKLRLADVLIRDINGDKIKKAKCSENEREILFKKNEKFRQFILDYSGDDYSLGAVLKRFIHGYNLAFTGISSPKAWIEKTTSTEIYAAELASIFPKAKFIHLIRDPRDNWASLSSGWDKRYQHYNDDIRRLKQSLLERGKLGMEMAKANQETIGADRYKVLKFEELTANAQSHLKSLSDFVGVEYNQNLLYPSTFGFRWDGNNFDGIKHQGPSSVNVNKWKQRINEQDAKLIEFHFREMMDFFGYERVYSQAETQKEATEHYKWFNFASPFSAK